MLTIVQAALEAGFLYAPIALALFLSFSILNIADMTTDGAFVLGSAVSAMMCLSGHPVLALPAGQEEDVVLYSTEGRALLFQTDGIPVKTTRSTQGVNVITLKPKYQLEWARPLAETTIVNTARYRARSLPIAGALLREEDRGETQMSLL